MGFADFFKPGSAQSVPVQSHTPAAPRRENVIDNAPAPVTETTSPYRVVGVWNADGSVNTSVDGTVELAGGRHAKVGEVIEATRGEYKVLTKRFVLSPVV